MKPIQLPIIAMIFVSDMSLAVDYTVDFTRVEEFETLRPLIENCADFDAMEHYRSRFESTANLEDLRATLTDIGFGMFNDCPGGISGPGIAPVGESRKPVTKGFTVDFTRVENMETIRPLIENCVDSSLLR